LPNLEQLSINFNKLSSSKDLFAYVPKCIWNLSYIGNEFETEKGLTEQVIKYFAALETLNGENISNSNSLSKYVSMFIIDKEDSG